MDILSNLFVAYSNLLRFCVSLTNIPVQLILTNCMIDIIPGSCNVSLILTFSQASDKVQLILTKGLIYTIPGTCAVTLQPRSTYVITGNVEAGKPWTNLCHFTKPWSSLSPKMKKGFRLLYQSGCDCPVNITPYCILKFYD